MNLKKNEYVQLSVLFIFWRLGLFALTYLGSQVFPKIANLGLGAIGPNKNFDFWSSWAQWDGGHYFTIATYGYYQIKEAAFFPFFPILTKVVEKLFFLNTLYAGLLVSNTAALLFILVFYKTVFALFNKKIAQTATITYLFFPASFFLGAFYSESLFLLFTTLSFYFLYQKKYAHVAVFSAFSALSRALGAFMAISQLYSYLASKNFKISKTRADIVLLTSPFFATLLYSAFLYSKFGNYFSFVYAQNYWERQIVGPFETLNSYLADIFTMKQRPINDFIDLGFTLAFFVILILGRKILPSSLWIFSTFALVIPASTATLTSMPRYLLASLGVFILIGVFFAKKPKISVFFWIISLTFQVFWAIMFVNGYWVA